MRIHPPVTTKAHQLAPAGCSGGFSFKEYEAAMAADPKAFAHFWGEIKYDGARYLLQIAPNKAKGNYLTSRRVSKVTGAYVEKQDKLPHLRDYKFPWTDTILDGELVEPEGGMSNEAATAVAEGRAVYKVFDVLRHNGIEFTSKPFSERRKLLKFLANNFPEWLTLTPCSKHPFRLFQLAKKQNLEGIILKDPAAIYGKGWYKVKNVETHDCVITGFQMSTEGKFAVNNWIKGVEIGQWRDANRVPPKARILKGTSLAGANQVLLYVGRISGFTDEQRAEITKNKAKLMGDIVEIKAQLRFEKTGLFRHPRFKRFRSDKNAIDCVWA